MNATASPPAETKATAATARATAPADTPPRPAPSARPRRRAPFVQPVRIDSDPAPLVGLYQPAEGRQRAVLICNPFGQEAIRAQRSLRVVAERLARLGVPSLRFDYFGTGDSPGEDGVGHLNRWRHDIDLADTRLRSLSGCSEIFWLGLRLGGTMALQAACHHSDLPRPARLILWEPVLDGPAYLRHLSAMHEFWTRRANVDTEALGFLLTSRLRRHIAAIHPTDLELPQHGIIDLLAPRQMAGRDAFVTHARQHLQVHDIVLESTVEWTSNTALDSQWVPDGALAALLDICAPPAS